METWLILSDVTGRQYPYRVDEAGLYIEDVLISSDNYNMNGIQSILRSHKTFKIGNRVFVTDKVIEIGVVQHPVGAT
jgi:hypothetical protein